MTAVTFDTLKFVKTLEAAGVEPRQAEAIADAQRAALAELVEANSFATKNDIDGLRNALRSDLAEMKFDLLKWIVGLSLAQISLVVGLFLKAIGN
jgi:predicted negative regulator of RcsB-dependent stress response